MAEWKECPDDVDNAHKYSVDRENPRIASMTGGNDLTRCVIISNSPLPLNSTITCNIRIRESKNNDGHKIFIGVAPSDINQNRFNLDDCGWYFNCYNLTLISGLPHRYRLKEYGPCKEDDKEGKYIHTGDTVSITMDTTKGDLSFIINGVNYGVAYEGIPLDKPLVPCVTLEQQGDSIELDPSQIPIDELNDLLSSPSNIKTKSETWDSITLSWDDVKDAKFYQIEFSGLKSWVNLKDTKYTKNGLMPSTGYDIRVRAVNDKNKVSEWSCAVKEYTKKSNVEKIGWKECPGKSDTKRYILNEKNDRIAIKSSYEYYCTIIGNAPLLPNETISWNVKILKTFNGCGDVYVGVAPCNINQDDRDNYKKCGWYFDCYGSFLYSGPPHFYEGKEYGPRKSGGKYVKKGDSVGLVMDNVKGKLSFVLKGVDLGVAYENIPLDKPLVPCTLLSYEGDSVELIFGEDKDDKKCVIS